MSHPIMNRSHIRHEFKACEGAGGTIPTRKQAGKERAALKAWAKKNPSPFNFNRRPKTAQ